MKQPVNQICQTVYTPRKARPPEQSFDQSEFVQNQSTFLKVAAKMQHRNDGNGNDFGPGNFNANIFLMSARHEKIVNKTVYCKSATAHSVVLFMKLFSDKILKEDILYFKY